MFDRVRTFATLPSHLRMPARANVVYAFLLNNLNFYRIHLLVFTFTPLIFSGIMYGISTAYPISYIDCLFNCMSAMTVTGLATVNLSTISVVQQVILFFQMCIGSLTFVSVLMIMVRIHFFRQKFRHVIRDMEAKEAAKRAEEGGGMKLSRTLSVMNPVNGVKNVKRRLSMGFAAKRPSEAPASTEQDSESSSHELKPVHNPHETTRTTSALAGRFPDTSGNILNVGERGSGGRNTPKKKKGAKRKINKDMIKRIDGGGAGMMNPMGWYDESPGHSPGSRTPADPISNNDTQEESDAGRGLIGGNHMDKENGGRKGSDGLPTKEDFDKNARSHGERYNVDEEVFEKDEEVVDNHGNHVEKTRQQKETEREMRDLPVTDSPREMSHTDGDEDLKPTKTPYAGRALDDSAFPRAKTIAFEDEEDGYNDHENKAYTTAREQGGGGYFPRTATNRSATGMNGGGGGAFPRTGTITGGSTFPRTYSLGRQVSRRPNADKVQTKLSDFGGFPTPFEIGKRVFKKVFPERHKTMKSALSMPRTNTIGGRGATIIDSDANIEKEVPYISFAATVGRNSRFEGLTDEQMEELGGVEYRALRVLFWITLGYYLFIQISMFIIMAPYIMAGGRYNYVFENQPQLVPIPWFALFQSVSAFSNTGMSLVDQSMLPFQTAYLMIACIVILIFAGNTAYPVFLRFTVWSIYKMTPRSSRIHESLKFLLDHPRRCFVYLFPSTQTWVLAIVMISLYMIDFVSFLVLDIGTETIQDIPVGTRIAAAFLQSAAVRAAGFAIVPIPALAPAVKVLYVIMMYISVYPIALSVRSTNVYEEKSLGLFEEELDEEDFEEGGEGASAVAKYVGWHARRQLAFDIWWLGFALWLICICERNALMADENATWFNIFSVVFEVVSAYGTVGLSLGVPYDNYSFSGSFGILAKLIVTLVMLRGRHRGLPVAIDRAVMLPKDFTAEEEEQFEETRSRRASRRASSIMSPEMFGRNSQTSFRLSPERYMSTLDENGEKRRTSSPGPTPIHSPSHLNSLPSNQALHPRSQSMSNPSGHAHFGNIMGHDYNPSKAGTGLASHAVGAHSHLRNDTTGSILTNSPTSLSFNLPRTSTERSRTTLSSSSGPPTSGNAAAALGTGGREGAGAPLTPVRESALSREATRQVD